MARLFCLILDSILINMYILTTFLAKDEASAGPGTMKTHSSGSSEECGIFLVIHHSPEPVVFTRAHETHFPSNL